MNVRLKKKYSDEIVPKLIEQFGFRNVMEVPRLRKIVLNCGVKEAVADSRVLNMAKSVLEAISGQAAVRTTARHSVAGFKIREGMPIGVKVTLRGDKMYIFLDKLVNAALPAVRDFHGVSSKLDGNGNYNLGISDWMVFPEVDYDKVEKALGLNVTIETSSSNDEHARALLAEFGMPFAKFDL
jgi:large subunit ribosomal protein L5